MLNYKIEYVKSVNSDGSLIWEELHGYSRPLYFTDKLDETLDSGVLTWLNHELLEYLEPSTQIRITMTDDSDGTSEVLEFVISDIQAEMTRAS